MLFTENRYDRGFEQITNGIPKFYPRGSEIVVTGIFHYTAETGSKIKVIFNVFKDEDLNIYQKLFAK